MLQITSLSRHLLIDNAASHIVVPTPVPTLKVSLDDFSFSIANTVASTASSIYIKSLMPLPSSKISNGLFKIALLANTLRTPVYELRRDCPGPKKGTSSELELL